MTMRSVQIINDLVDAGLDNLAHQFQSVEALPSKRARELGVPFDGQPGQLNAITDVGGVEVGFTTLISGSGELVVGKGPVRTGVTAILPRGQSTISTPVFAGWFSQNGNGEMTGTAWIEESGFLEGPVMITNTNSVGVVRDAVIEWHLMHADDTEHLWSLPVVAETCDDYLNDINGFHIKRDHVWQALDAAQSGPVAEGNVGGGTGMICYDFKGGTGTASRRVNTTAGDYLVGVLVQCNCGDQRQLTIAGVPVGREIPEQSVPSDDGSIIVVIATDAPLLPHQLKRVARRATMGLARTGSTSDSESGDIFIAFSTAHADVQTTELINITMLANDQLTPLFEAVVQATEEAIINALVAAETMAGVDDHLVNALPHQQLQEAMKKYR